VAEDAFGAVGYDRMQVWRVLWFAVPEKPIRKTINGTILSRKGTCPGAAGDLHARHGGHCIGVGVFF